MNKRLRYLHSLRDDIGNSFGTKHDHFKDIENIIKYWSKQDCEPDEKLCDIFISGEISGLKNEIKRREGKQPWQITFDEIMIK